MKNGGKSGAWRQMTVDDERWTEWHANAESDHGFIVRQRKEIICKAPEETGMKQGMKEFHEKGAVILKTAAEVRSE